MNKDKLYNPYYRSHLNAYICIGIIILVYLLKNTSILSYKIMQMIILVINYTVAIVLFRLPKDRCSIRRSKREEIYLVAFLFATIYVLIYMGLGLIDGFGRSPYNHTWIGYLNNMLFLVGSILFYESLRSKILFNLSVSHTYIKILLISILLTLISFNIVQYKNLGSIKEIVYFLAENILPMLSRNILLCHMTMYGGIWASIIYIGIVDGIHWCVPVLPNLKWINQGLIGMMLPMFFIMVLEFICPLYSRDIKRYKRDRENPATWIITSIVSIMIIWFAVGVFPIYPSAIATGSMKPYIDIGDVIILKRMELEDIVVGDIIQFDRDGMNISHRVCEIMIEDDVREFKTWGDNNKYPDSRLVKTNEIKGKVVYKIPKIGHLTLLVKSRNLKDERLVNGPEEGILIKDKE